MNPKIKCVSVDIDGTLLKENVYLASEISPENITAIREFCHAGGKLILATGRDLSDAEAVRDYLLRGGISAESIPYLVCLNGSLIIDKSNDDHVIHRGFFGEEKCRAVVDFLVSRKVDFFLVDSEKGLIFDPFKPLSWIVYWVQFKRKYRRSRFVEDLYLGNIKRVMVVLKVPKAREFKKEIMRVFGSDCYCSIGPKFFVEIIDNDVNKFYALKTLSKVMGIDLSEFAALGNEQNDIMSLENVGYGVGFDLLRKGENLIWDKKKIHLHFENGDGKGVARVFEYFRSEGLF